jgi:hypothetical protein
MYHLLNIGSGVFVKHNRIKIKVINKLLYWHKLSRNMFRPLLGHLQAVGCRSITKSKVLRLPAGIPSVTFTFGYTYNKVWYLYDAGLLDIVKDELLDVYTLLLVYYALTCRLLYWRCSWLCQHWRFESLHWFIPARTADIRKVLVAGSLSMLISIRMSMIFITYVVSIRYMVSIRRQDLCC